MSDSDRRDKDRRRVGDATRQRIDDLATGWGDAKSKAKVSPEQPAGRRESPMGRVAPSEPDTVRMPKQPPPLPVTQAEPVRRPSPPRPQPPPPAAPAQEPFTIEASAQAHDATIETPPNLDDIIHRADRTTVQRDAPASGVVRDPVTLTRKRGLAGDMSYVFKALFGVAEARGELGRVAKGLETERAERTDRLKRIARQAVADSELELPAIDEARDQLAEIEERRSRQAGGVAAADAEVESLRHARAQESEQQVAEVKRLEEQLVAIVGKLQPLERDAQAARKKAAELRSALKGLDQKLKAIEAKMVKVKGPKADPAAIEAELASLRAERESVARDEPAIAADLDELDPKIASLAASKRDTELEIETIRAADKDGQVRTEEIVAATEARKQVINRAVADLDKEREGALESLGERLCHERAASFAPRLRAIDEHDVSIATLERRAIELDELVSGVDKAKIARGVAMIVLLAAAAGSLVWLVLG